MGKNQDAYIDFQSELHTREHEIASLLPRHVSRERFMSSAVAAVKQNPELLSCTPRSLFQAVTQSAQDGLLPDGREGVITVYNQKVKQAGKDVWEKTAKWNPMVWGLRKRARETDEIIIDARVVHANDQFIWRQGDDPKIEHIPAGLGTPRGEMIGSYAIFKNKDKEILHREVMDRDQIAKVREASKAPISLMWTSFAEEGWKKSVVRRGIKSIPCSEKLESVVHRDDDLFAFEPEKPKPVVIQGQAEGSKKPLPPMVQNRQGPTTKLTTAEQEDEIADLLRHQAGEGEARTAEAAGEVEEDLSNIPAPFDRRKGRQKITEIDPETGEVVK